MLFLPVSVFTEINLIDAASSFAFDVVESVVAGVNFVNEENDLVDAACSSAVAIFVSGFAKIESGCVEINLVNAGLDIL